MAQVSVLNELTTILCNFESIDTHNIAFAGDFDNIFFDTSLDAKGRLMWYVENKKP